MPFRVPKISPLSKEGRRRKTAAIGRRLHPSCVKTEFCAPIEAFTFCIVAGAEHPLPRLTD